MSVRVNRSNVFKLLIACLLLSLVYEICRFFEAIHYSYTTTKVQDRFAGHLNSSIRNRSHNYFNRKQVFQKIESELTTQTASNTLKTTAKIEQVTRGSNVSNYALALSKERLDRLLDTLYSKETGYAQTLDELQVISFRKLAQSNVHVDQQLPEFSIEKRKYLQVVDGRVRATVAFLNYLNAMSEKFSFLKPRNNIVKARIEHDKPTIVTAANSAYYMSLQATVANVHQHFPDYPLIVYDLGLDPDQLEMVVKYDLSQVASRHSAPHILDLKVFAWKPLIIQHALNTHSNLIYIDTSIRFHNNQLQPLFNTVKETGIMTQYIGLKLVCYTNPKQFEWFGETTTSYAEFYSMEAGLVFMHDTFLTRLILKAWATCALDVSCIAPEGSRVHGCCGCHRYDQDALTIISSFFFAHPKTYSHLPAYSFTKEESYFFQIRRYEGREYFTRKNLFL